MRDYQTADNLKWYHDQAQSAKSSMDSASGRISGDSVESPSGCGSSASAAMAVVSSFQLALSGLQSSIPSLSSSMSSADSNITSADTQSASSVPQCRRSRGRIRGRRWVRVRRRRVVQGVGSLIRLRIPSCLRMRGRRGVALLVGRRQGLVRGRRRMRV